MKQRLLRAKLMFVLVICSTAMWADKEMYARLSGSTLTFYYDENKTDGDHMVTYWAYDETLSKEVVKNITHVIFDSSFAEARLTSTYCLFSSFVNLQAIEGISNLNTSDVTDMRGMFGGCSSLKSLDVSNFNTSKVTDMQELFAGCSSLTSLNVSNFDTGNVINMCEMFGRCSGLTSLDVSNLNTNNVTRMDGMFIECSSLSSLDVSHFNTRNVTRMDGMFAGCSSLTSLDISNFITENVINMFYMFGGCTFTNLDLSNFNTRNVTNMGAMFEGCNSLMSLVFDNFETGNVTNMEFMFANCNSLTSLDLNHFDTSNVTNMWGMFKGCNSLTSLDLNYFDTSNVTNMEDMFERCSSLQRLNISNFDTGNVTNMCRMFMGCKALISIDVSNFDTSKVTDMGDLFCGCSNLQNLDISNFNTDNVTDMRWMFNGCSALEFLDISNFNTSNVFNMGGMFGGCSGLTELNLLPLDFRNVRYITDMFNDCSKLETIYCNADLSGAELGDNVFYNCTALVGAKGTSYDWNNIDKTFARPDKDGQPGYFTDKEFTGLTPIEDELNYQEGGNIDESTDLSGTIIDNVYYNISSDNGGYDAEEGCLFVNKSMTDEEIESVFGKELASSELKETYTGIVILLPAGIGIISVNAETVGDLTLMVKVGDADPVSSGLEGKQKLEVPYNVIEPTYVYIYAGTDVAVKTRVFSSSEQASLKIYGICVNETPTTPGDVDGDGDVTTADVAIVSDYIMDKRNVKIILKAADLNSDKKIDVADIVLLVKKINITVR